jgi:HSP20 family protein
MADQDRASDENPHQGPGDSFGKNIETRTTPATSDRERSIAQGRETPRANAARPSPLPSRASATHGYGPFTLMRRLSDDMDRLFENLGFGRGLGTGTPSLWGTDRDPWSVNTFENDAGWLPQVEAFRRGDKFVVRADLPGTRKEDVHAEIEDGVLTISGQRMSEREDNRDDYYRSERSYGSFYRAIPLPDGVESDNCEATFKDGVLEVTLPAPKEASRSAKQIQIR